MLPSLQAVQSWDKVAVSTWLGKVGLSQYVKTFSELDVDGEVLVMDLDEDLAKEEVKMSANHIAFLMDWIDSVKSRRKLKVPYPNAKPVPASPIRRRVPTASASPSPVKRSPKTNYSPPVQTPVAKKQSSNTHIIAQLQMEIQRLKQQHANEILDLQQKSVTLERRASSAASPAIVMSLQKQITQSNRTHAEQIKAANSAKEALEAENMRLKVQLASTQGSPQKLIDLQKQIQVMTTSHIQQIQVMSSENEALEAEIETLKTQAKSKSAVSPEKISQLQKQIQGLAQSLTSTSTEKMKLQQEVQSLRTKLQSTQASSESPEKISQLQSQIQALTEAHIKELREVRSQKKDVEMEFQMQTANLTNLQMQLADSESKTLKLENNLSSVNKMFSDMATRFAETQKGVERLPIVEAQLQSLTSEANQLRKSKETSDKELLESKTELATLRTRVASLSKEKAELDISIKNLKEKQLSDETALTDRFQAQLGRLIGSIQQKDKEYSQLESMHSAMIEELTVEQGEAEKMIDELEAKELSQLKEIKRLEKVVKDAEKREASIREQLSQWKQYQQETDTEKSQQIEMLMQQQSAIEKEHEEYMATELARRDDEIEKYRQQNSDKDAEMKKLKEELAEKTKRVQDLYEQDKETKEKMFALQDNLLRFTDKLSQKDDEIKIITAESEKTSTSLQAQLASFEEEILERDQFIDELSSNNVKQVENLAQMRHQNEALSSELMALSQSLDEKDKEILHLVQHHGSLDAKIQDVMEREKAIMEKSNHLVQERDKIEKLFREREAIEMEKRAWTQREQQLQNFENQVKEKHRDVTEVLRREAEVTKREEGLLRRETAIERIEEKQREQIALHMKSIAENQRNLSMQKTELSELEALLKKRKEQMKEMEKQHQENIRTEAAAVEEAGARMKEIDKRLSEREAQLDARDQVLKNKKDDLSLLEKELNHRKKMLDGREVEVKNAEESVKFRKNKVDQDERRLYFGTSGESSEPKNYYVSRTSMMASRPEHLGKFKVSGARDRAVSSVDAQNNIYHQMWRVKENQIRKEGGPAPRPVPDRRATIAVTPGSIEKIQAASPPLIAPPNLPSLDTMLNEEEKREASPEAPMVMLMPTQAPVVPPTPLEAVPLEVRRASMAPQVSDQTEGASKITQKAKETDEGPDILIGSNASGADMSEAFELLGYQPPPAQPTQTSNDTEGEAIQVINPHPPAPAPTVLEPIAPAPAAQPIQTSNDIEVEFMPVQNSHPPAPVPTTVEPLSHSTTHQTMQASNDTEGEVLQQRRSISHPPAPVPSIVEPAVVDAKLSHPPAPMPTLPTQRASISHPPAPVPTSPTSHPPAPVPKSLTSHPPAPAPAVPKTNSNQLIAVETKQGIGKIESSGTRLQAAFLPNQVWDVDLPSCIPLTSGTKIFSPYGPSTLVSVTDEGLLVVKLENGEMTRVKPESCQSEYRHYYNKTLEDLCFGDKLESDLVNIPDSFLMELRFHDVERKIKISLDEYGRRVFSLRI